MCNFILSCHEKGLYEKLSCRLGLQYRMLEAVAKNYENKLLGVV